MILYWPVPSVTAVRTFSMSAGLEASTVTPGSTAPEESRTTPAMVPDCPCANAEGMSMQIVAATMAARVMIRVRQRPTWDVRPSFMGASWSAVRRAAILILGSVNVNHLNRR